MQCWISWNITIIVLTSFFICCLFGARNSWIWGVQNCWKQDVVCWWLFSLKKKFKKLILLYILYQYFHIYEKMDFRHRINYVIFWCSTWRRNYTEIHTEITLDLYLSNRISFKIHCFVEELYLKLFYWRALWFPYWALSFSAASVLHCKSSCAQYKKIYRAKKFGKVWKIFSWNLRYYRQAFGKCVDINIKIKCICI